MSGSNVGVLHRHGHRVHSHASGESPHRHLVLPQRSESLPDGPRPSASPPRRARWHGHSHGLVDRSIVRSHDGVRAVAISLAVLGVAAGAQLAVFVVSGSVALLADLIHNFGDALTAMPLGIAFYLRIPRREARRAVRRARDLRLGLRGALRDDPALHPPAGPLPPLGAAAAGVIGFVGNEVAAQVRLRAGRRLAQPGAGRGRQPRARRRLRLARRGRQRDRCRARRCDRRPDHRARDHARDPQDHLGLVADRLEDGTRSAQRLTTSEFVCPPDRGGSDFRRASVARAEARCRPGRDAGLVEQSAEDHRAPRREVVLVVVEERVDLVRLLGEPPIGRDPLGQLLRRSTSSRSGRRTCRRGCSTSSSCGRGSGCRRRGGSPRTPAGRRSRRASPARRPRRTRSRAARGRRACPPAPRARARSGAGTRRAARAGRAAPRTRLSSSFASGDFLNDGWYWSRIPRSLPESSSGSIDARNSANASPARPARDASSTRAP